jgi:dipeptidase
MGYDRGETLKPSTVDLTIYPWTLTKPIGHIPQVHKTYSYIDGNYPIMNEKQVAFGESTCAGRLIATPIDHNGTALFDISEVSRVAMERATSAREAIQIMGQLTEQYGYYGAEWDDKYAHGEAGEALTVTDKNEAWVFHIIPDDTGKSSVWAAQR